MFQFRRALLLLLAFLLLPATTSRAATPLEAMREERPLLRPEVYFRGRTHSWGVFESRSGAPKQILRGRTHGYWEGKVFRFEQDLQFQSGRKMHRSWVLRRVGSNGYEATGTGIVGKARGEVRGNTFHLEFTLDAIPGNPLGHARMSQWLYLQPDGVTLLNRAKISKAGVVVAEVTEQFRKER